MTDETITGGSKKDKIKTYGSRLEVWRGLSRKTSGKLTKNDLKYNKKGNIVSKKASDAAKKRKNLGYFINNTKKGFFTKQPRIGTKEYNDIIEKNQSLSNSST